MRREVVARGVSGTPVLDRQYFHSICFREPNGVRFGLASTPPGFTVDEPLDSLGHARKLPPAEEAHRARIEALLPAVRS